MTKIELNFFGFAKEGRQGIGIDIDRKYCELSKKRLQVEGQIDQLKLPLAAVGSKRGIMYPQSEEGEDS